MPKSQLLDAPVQPSSVISEIFWVVSLSALLLMRLLVPTEGTEQGHTLWIACLTFAFAGLRAFWVSRDSDWNFPRFHLADLAVVLLVGGYALSTAFALTKPADHRAALNSLWEWMSIGVYWALVRDISRNVGSRQVILGSILITGVCLSGLGLWQHYVWYPEQSRALKELVELQTLFESQHQLSVDQAARRMELIANLGDQAISLTGGARQAMLDRVTQSVEPIGRFALANSFAALLMVTFFLMINPLRRQVHTNPRALRTLVIGLALGCTVVCLLLTKSRTALIAVILAGSCLIVLKLFFKNNQARTVLKTVLKSGLAWVLGLIILIGVIAISGGLDREVLSEAPKSLKYRLEYWQATLGVIADHPVLGVGSGNFRQNYFKHKLPGSSEEILDPHNSLLDAWSQGGIIALSGLGLMLFVVIRVGYSQCLNRSLDVSDEHQGQPARAASMAAPAAVFIAILMVLVQQAFLEGFDDVSLAVFGLVSIPVAIILSSLAGAASNSKGLLVTIILALNLHLLGAGGISMPAILGMILCLLAFIVPNETSGRPVPKNVVTGLWVGSLTLTVLCLWSSLVPNLHAKMLVEQGRNTYQFQGAARKAEQILEKAVEADSLSPDALFQLASLRFQEWTSQPSKTQELKQAIETLQSSITKDPLGAKRVLLMTEWQYEFFKKSNSEADLEKAIASGETAISIYPHYAPNWVMLARLLDSKARLNSDQFQINEMRNQAIRQAIDLDDLNRKNGHSDKYLPQIDRDFLDQRAESIAAGETD